MRDLVEKKTIDDDLKGQLHAAMKEFIKGVASRRRRRSESP